ncbi:MAG: hypothetical protein ACE5ID_05285 [Acidobacteriota bacterium]
MMRASPPITQKRILAFWAPMAATWLMMAVEGPFLAAVIARLDQPKVNLAAYGVALAVALMMESPIIMMLSAATALVESAPSFHRLKNFTYTLNLLLTAAIIAMLATPFWRFLAGHLIGLPPAVVILTQKALLLLIPWPAAIGYRRFYQGILIRSGHTRRVAYGTVVRLSAMAATGLALALQTSTPGALIGAAALSAGVSAEAVASRFMSMQVVRDLLDPNLQPTAPRDPLTYSRIIAFYYPLFLTSTISMAAQPVVTFFMGRAPFPLESLAVLPVIITMVFIFRSLGLAYQEVGIALLARSARNRAPVLRFAFNLALLDSLALAAIAFSPLGTLWFRQVAGLTQELTGFALPPVKILVLMPALSVLLSLQRAILVHDRRTRPITWATLLELGGIVGVLLYSIQNLSLPGATAAAIAFMAGRLAANLVLVPPCLKALAGKKPDLVAAG